MKIIRYRKIFSEEDEGGPSLSGMVGGGAAIAGAGLGATAAGYYGLSKRSYNKAVKEGMNTGMSHREFFNYIGKETKDAKTAIENKITNVTEKVNNVKSQKLKDFGTEKLSKLHDQLSTVGKDTTKTIRDIAVGGNEAVGQNLDKSISRFGKAKGLGKAAAVVGGIGLGMYGLSKLGGKKKNTEEKTYSELLEKQFNAAANKMIEQGVKKQGGKITNSLRNWWNKSSNLEKTALIGGGSVLTGVTGGAMLGASGAK